MTNNNIHLVKLSRQARKDLKKAPIYIGVKLASWIELIKYQGLNEARKIPGYHDEPLKGNRAGQRSVRLNKSYRAIYETQEETIKFIEIMEITKHEY